MREDNLLDISKLIILKNTPCLPTCDQKKTMHVRFVWNTLHNRLLSSCRDLCVQKTFWNFSIAPCSCRWPEEQDAIFSPRYSGIHGTFLWRFVLGSVQLHHQASLECWAKSQRGMWSPSETWWNLEKNAITILLVVVMMSLYQC